MKEQIPIPFYANPPWSIYCLGLNIANIAYEANDYLRGQLRRLLGIF